MLLENMRIVSMIAGAAWFFGGLTAGLALLFWDVKIDEARAWLAIKILSPTTILGIPVMGAVITMAFGTLPFAVWWIIAALVAFGAIWLAKRFTESRRGILKR